MYKRTNYVIQDQNNLITNIYWLYRIHRIVHYINLPFIPGTLKKTKLKFVLSI